MAAHATHSRMFSEYKNSQECILVNWSTNAYMTVLDQLLYSAMIQVVDCSDFLQEPVAALIAWYTIHSKRKISITEKPEAITNLIQFLINDDPEAKMAAYRRAQIERNVTRTTIDYFSKFLAHYREHSLLVFTGRDPRSETRVRLQQLAGELRLFADYTAFGLAEVVVYWQAQESEFRRLILQKYTRMILNVANRDYKQFNFEIDIDDFVHNYMIAALKAIDKSSVGDMGTLTIYIQSWLKNALLNTVTNYNYSVPFTVPPNKLAEHIGSSVNVDEPEVHQDLAQPEPEDEGEHEANAVIDRIRRLAKAVDPTGVGRMLLGVDEILSPAEIACINPQLGSVALV